MADYRKLDVFAAAHELAVELHHMTREMPRGYRGELGDQLRRASMSVAANIVEGCGRDSDGDMRRHFRIALGAAAEVEYLLIYARDTGISPKPRVEPLVSKAASVRRMTAGFIKRVSKDTDGDE
ncbi:MAG TPA: four helix bundle protein [Gemmatimonadaceae bacterium]